jgi:tetratricopeptide (TPR) repeat protein
MAIKFFSEAMRNYEMDKSRVEYKSSNINLAYCYLSLGDSETAFKTLNEYLATNKSDPDALICEAYIYNSIGLGAYKTKDYKNSITNLNKAHELQKWPLFGSNLITAYILACDLSPKNEVKQQYLKEALKIYNLHKSHDYWKDPTRNYLQVGIALEKYLKKYKVPLEETVLPVPSPTPGFWKRIFN